MPEEDPLTMATFPANDLVVKSGWEAFDADAMV